ncbi:hypothetical protein PBRA_009118 [Plasmodiophora brassicae]|nr:hypothetical protein PBRA_009118 [Plasmodiophora brassicae]
MNSAGYASSISMNNVSQRRWAILIDDSEGSVAAARWSVANLARSGDDITLVTAVEHQTGLHDALLLALSPLMFTTLGEPDADPERAIDLLSKFRDMLEPTDRTWTTHCVAIDGDKRKGPALVDFAAREHLDFVVVGSRHLGSVFRILLEAAGDGSFSDYAIHNMPCPVVVVLCGRR